MEIIDTTVRETINVGKIYPFQETAPVIIHRGEQNQADDQKRIGGIPIHFCSIIHI